MTMNFLDATGLAHFWAKIKAHVLQNGIFYGTCGTGGGTVAKVATVTGVTELKTGLTVAIKFTAANTVANPTLNVNSLGAKAIKRYGTTAPSTSAASSWNADSVVTLTYDGTYWMLHDWNNTTYSSMSVAEYEAGTSTSARVITPARLKGAILYWAQEKLVSGTNIKTINNTSLLGPGDISISSGLEPLIGDTTNTVPLQVKNALREGRTVCLQDDGSLAGVNLDLRFTTWNGATDTVYSGAAIDIVASQTLAYYSGTYYLFELVGAVGGGWELFSTSLAEQSDIPTVPTNVSDFNNDAGYITTETDPTVPSWAKASTKPSYTASEVGALDNTGGQVTGDITLYTASGNSPSIIFQRGTLTDNYNDWQIYDKGGFLYFAQRGQSSSAFADQVYFNTTGGVYATTYNGSGANLTGVLKSSDITSTINSSSTNSQAAGAKAVYDIIGDIETLLAAL